jgi:hypothetical protein
MQTCKEEQKNINQYLFEAKFQIIIYLAAGKDSITRIKKEENHHGSTDIFYRNSNEDLDEIDYLHSLKANILLYPERTKHINPFVVEIKKIILFIKKKQIKNITSIKLFFYSEAASKQHTYFDFRNGVPRMEESWYTEERKHVESKMVFNEVNELGDLLKLDRSKISLNHIFYTKSEIILAIKKNEINKIKEIIETHPYATTLFYWGRLIDKTPFRDTKKNRIHDFTALFYAVSKKNLEITKLILEKKPTTGLKDSCSNLTVMHIAAKNADLDMIQFFLKNYPEIALEKTQDKKTFLDIAKEKAHFAIIDFCEREHPELFLKLTSDKERNKKVN